MYRKLKKVRILKVILGTAMGITIFMMFGTAGSLEVDAITVGAAFQAIVIYAAILFITGNIMKRLEIQEQEILDIIIARREEYRRMQAQKEERWRRYFQESNI